MLDGCWFQRENAPIWPHHPNCHCTLDPVDYSVVLMNAATYSDYSKFDPCPHHPYCHCTLEPIDYALVLANAAALSDFTKYDPYLFDPENFYKHGKNKAFESWGYTITDSPWLKDEIERQASEQYARGDYSLGVLNRYGQHINIRIEIPRKDGTGKVSFITGWTIYPNGQIKLNTPYGGK